MCSNPMNMAINPFFKFVCIEKNNLFTKGPIYKTDDNEVNLSGWEFEWEKTYSWRPHDDKEK